MKAFKPVSTAIIVCAISFISSTSYGGNQVPLSSLNPGATEGLNASVFSMEPTGKAKDHFVKSVNMVSKAQLPFIQNQIDNLSAAINLKPELLAKLKANHQNIAIEVFDRSKELSDSKIDNLQETHVGISTNADGTKYLAISIFAGKHTASIASAQEILQNEDLYDRCDVSKNMGVGCSPLDILTGLSEVKSALNAQGNTSAVTESKASNSDISKIEAASSAQPASVAAATLSGGAQ